MKRLLVLTAATLLCLGLLGCSPDDEAAVTVNGDEVLTVGDLEEQLEEIREDEDFLTTFDGRGEGAGTLSSGFVSSVLTNHVFNGLLAADLAAEGVETTDADRTAAEEQLAAAVGGPVDSIPPSYRGLLLDLFTNALALEAALGDRGALEQRATELLTTADVDIADRYGSWDSEAGEAVAPEGPVTPTTTIPIELPAGG